MKTLERVVKIVVGLMIGIALIAVVISEFMKKEKKGSIGKVLQKAEKLVTKNAKPAIKSLKSKTKSLTERQDRIVSILKARKKLTADDLAAKIKDVNVRSIRRDLAKLSDLKIIEKKGSTKGTFYKLK